MSMLMCLSGALHNDLYITGGLPQTEGSEVQQQGTVQAGGGRSPGITVAVIQVQVSTVEHLEGLIVCVLDLYSCTTLHMLVCPL